VPAIVRTVKKLRDDAELRRSLGSDGRKAYEDLYSWTIMEQRILDSYKIIGSD
jgi:hypothetical protein